MKWVAAPAAMSAALVLAGCTPEQQRGFLPEGSTHATTHTEAITSLWVNGWIVLMVVGVITWALVIWASIAYRRRKGQTGLPVQFQYNLPIETFFTIVPVILIVGFFAFTAQLMTDIDERVEAPDNTIEVIAKRWSWDFNYVDDDVYFSGVQVQTDSEGEATEATMPKLYLPVGETTEVRLETRDVIHSFWIVEFLNKKDMIPGQTNYLTFTPQETGVFRGKCAELCGEYHSMMLFEVHVVEQDEYDAYIASLRDAGNTGQMQLDDLNPMLDTDAGFPRWTESAQAENE